MLSACIINISNIKCVKFEVNTHITFDIKLIHYILSIYMVSNNNVYDITILKFMTILNTYHYIQSYYIFVIYLSLMCGNKINNI